MSAPLITDSMAFAQYGLDRCSTRRRDPAWLAEALGDPDAALALFHRGQPFLLQARSASVARGVGWMAGSAADALCGPDPLTVFLGLDAQGRPHFAARVPEALDPAELPIADLGQFEDLRGAAMELPPGEAALLGAARSLFEWHARSGFCANCGEPTKPVDGGWKRACAACGAEHFPRLDPVAIMLPVRDGMCCVGRQARFPAGMFSALAGFVEPGETLEQACARELEEEVGLRALSVRYVGGQPWPFPHSLMIGLIAEVAEGPLRLDEDEIVEAIWLTREEAREALAGRLNKEGRRLWAPPPIAIAHHLMKAWLAEEITSGE